MPVSRHWRRWRRFIQRHIDISGLLYLTVALLTVALLSMTRNGLLLGLLLLLPISLLAVFGGWVAGLLGGIVAALLTAPPVGRFHTYLTPPLAPELWLALAVCYLLFGVLLGIQRELKQRQRERQLAEIEAKLEHARIAAERYQALLEEMSEGQEFLTRMNEELAALNTIATAVNSSLDVREVQATALALLSALLTVDEGLIYWISEGGERFVLQAARPLSDAEVAAAAPVALDAGLLGRVVTSQRAEAISELSRELDQRPPAMSAEVKSILAIPLRTRSRLFGVLVLGRRSGRSFSDDDEKFLASVGRVLAVAIENATLFKQTRDLTLSDELTGVANRRMFNLQLTAEISHARITGARLSLILFDLDLFKQVNDQYGHPVGDEVLCWFAKVVQQEIRGSDLFCRIGGEEFALIAPDLLAADALTLAQRIGRRVAETPCIPAMGEAIHITVSAGVASYSDDTATVDTLTAAADRALYAAKTGGRNQVVQAELADVRR